MTAKQRYYQRNRDKLVEKMRERRKARRRAVTLHKECPWCGEEFDTTYTNKVYCHRKCKTAALAAARNEERRAAAESQRRDALAKSNLAAQEAARRERACAYDRNRRHLIPASYTPETAREMDEQIAAIHEWVKGKSNYKISPF